MPYYGDYYAGDPGLFSFIGKALGTVAKVALPVARAIPGVGGVVSAVTGIVGSLANRGTPAPGVAAPAAPLMSAVRRAPARRKARVVYRYVTRKKARRR